MAHEVQFPLATSLPWILTEHAITCNAAPTLQSLQYAFFSTAFVWCVALWLGWWSPCVRVSGAASYTLDIYNDAAHAALNVYSQQFLFDEVEAEVCGKTACTPHLTEEVSLTDTLACFLLCLCVCCVMLGASRSTWCSTSSFSCFQTRFTSQQSTKLRPSPSTSSIATCTNLPSALPA